MREKGKGGRERGEGRKEGRRTKKDRKSRWEESYRYEGLNFVVGFVLTTLLLSSLLTLSTQSSRLLRGPAATGTTFPASPPSRTAPSHCAACGHTCTSFGDSAIGAGCKSQITVAGPGSTAPGALLCLLLPLGGRLLGDRRRHLIRR